VQVLASDIYPSHFRNIVIDHQSLLMITVAALDRYMPVP